MQDHFRFFEDSSHGWLEVPAEVCRALGLQGKISGYSYGKGDKLYLEEDSDAGVFITAWEKETGKEWAIERPDGYYDRPHETKIYNNTSPVRGYGGIPEEFLKCD